MAEPQDDPSGRLPEGGAGDQGPDLGERPFIPADPDEPGSEETPEEPGEVETPEGEPKPKKGRPNFEELERRLTENLTRQFQAMQSTIFNKLLVRQREADAPAAKPDLSLDERADQLTDEIYRKAESIEDPVKRERFIVREVAKIPMKIQEDIQMDRGYSQAMAAVKQKWPFLEDDEIRAIATKVAQRPSYENADTAWSEEVEQHLARAVARGEGYKKVLDDRFKSRRRAGAVQGNSGQPPARRKPADVPPMTMAQQRAVIAQRKVFRGTG